MSASLLRSSFPALVLALVGLLSDTAFAQTLSSGRTLRDARRAQGYDVIDLGILPGASRVVPQGLNARGDAVGYVQGSGFYLRAFLYTEATGMVPLVPPGFTDSAAVDVTDSGAVLGYAQNGVLGGPSARGWIWQDGEFTLLPPFPASCSGITPRAMNDAWQVVGITCPDSFPQDAFFWSASTGYVNLTDGFGIDEANDVNALGVVTGGTNGGAVRWSVAGGLESLGFLPSPYDDAGYGTAINDLGQVTGYAVNVVTGPDFWRAFRFDDSGGTQELTPIAEPLARTVGVAIDSSGRVLGSQGGTSSYTNAPWLWTPATGRVFLNDVVEDPRFAFYEGPAGLNDAGQVLLLAGSSDPADPLSLHAVLVSPRSALPSISPR